MKIMDLNERKRRILAAIIETYIETADPVGSKAVAELSGLGVSSATIRNEMAELEELGWLEQPHTSAGRVPSAQGYRAYVDYLMRRHRLTDLDLMRTNAFLHSRVSELERMLDEAGRIISELTGYPSLTMRPQLRGSAIRRIDLLPVDRHQFVLLLVTTDGMVKNRICRTWAPIEPALLQEVSSLVDRRLCGLPLTGISPAVVEELHRALDDFSFVLEPVLQTIREAAESFETPEVVLDGEQRLFDLPEYRDLDKTRDFLTFLQDQGARRQVLSPAQGHDGITITIGSEHPLEELRESSVIMGNYKLGDRPVGIIAVIGPTRMHYNRVFSQIEYFTQGLNHLLSQLVGPKEE
ncbi:MAG: heat-inducible transcription repressor HrcA [Clostridiales bacterium]|nr:heat-inducible transcription repressor HrcA [Clostridiales bacterium]